MANAVARPNPERTRLIIGGLLYAFLMICGASILAYYFLLPPLFTKDPLVRYQAMGMGALLAFPPLILYLWLPWIIDRFDPEPWWCLGLALAWGAIAACGFSALINTNVEELTVMAFGGAHSKTAVGIGEVVGSCISAPLTEEFWKGLAVFGTFYFLRREFDGVVDGIIYATFCALGFAATENVIYYARAGLEESMKHHSGALAGTVLIRGVLSPWGHPLYTSMTGIGFGIWRETEHAWLRWLAPLFGYFVAVILHSTWNAAATIGGGLVVPMIVLWFLFVLAFIAILAALVMRKGRIIRDNLRDEVLMGNLAQQELDLICSPIGRLRATFGQGGAAGRKFIASGARLGLCKWHAARAMRGQKRTVSMDFIVPLRQELFVLRQQMWAAAGRPMPQAVAWQPPQQQVQPPQQGYRPPGPWVPPRT